MKSFKLKRLYISNFKIFANPITIDFQNKDFIVFDGPNGFGKTTIYDAIEILISGRVNRVVNTEFNAVNKSVIYANDDNKPIIIKGEFIDLNNDSLILMRKIENPKSRGRINKLEKRFSVYRLTDFDNSIYRDITQSEINQILGLVPDKDIYNLMYYMQQEDSFHFLKKSEKARLEYINKLFNIDKEQNEAKKIKIIRDNINSRKLKVSRKIDELNQKLSQFSFNLEGDNSQYSKVIFWKDIRWDYQNVELNDDNYNRYINELNHIIKLLNVYDDFEKYNKNKLYKAYLEDNNTLMGSIVALEFISRYNEIMDQYNKQLTYIRINQHIVDSNYCRILDFNNIEYIIKELCPNVNFVQLKEYINNIKNLKEISSDFSELIRGILDTRNLLVDKVKKIDNFAENMCPLCGYDYNQNNEKLRDKIKNREKYFLSKLDDVSEKINTIKEQLKKLYMDEIYTSINKILKGNKLNSNFMDELREYYKFEKEILKFKDFCDRENINLEKYINKEFNKPVAEVDVRLIKLRNEIASKVVPIDSYFLQEDEKKYKNIIKEIFNDNKDYILKTTIDDIQNKKKYLKSLYYDVKYIEKGKLLKEIDKTKKEYTILNKYLKKYDEIYSIYQEKTRTYCSKMIDYLSVPFYIYSGKILQDYQEGLGVFIKSEKKDEQIRIKFVNNNESKHDLINKFSSGQLSGLIISFLLSLNMVYSKRDLGILLIDDPLQTMDDINMASFVELIRHEFSGNQLFMSTHEDSLSRYMRYKFKKFGIEPLRLNMKELTHK